MRNLIFILFLFCSSVIQAEEFTVFEKDGYFGIKDEIGNVTVPAVYEKLGWSNGTSKVQNGVIGFRRNNLWGLITVRNKALTEQKFYTIEPISSDYFKASIKGRFSNYLFHGILDSKGKTIISFNYFTIEPLGINWLVSTFDGKRQQFGVVSFDNVLVVPTNYSSIREERNLLHCKQTSRKLDIYNTSGYQLQLDLDSVKFQNGLIAFRDGYAGFLSDLGQEIHPFDFKNFSIVGNQIVPISFPEWTVYQADTTFLKWKCDSLSVSNNGMLVAYLNGAHHLLLGNKTLLNNHELILKEVSNNQLIVQNSKNRKWALLKKDGSKIISEYDSIQSMSNHYACLNAKGWHLIDQEGRQINKLPLQSISSGLKNQFLVKRNNHWGILKLNTRKKVTYKYDSIVTGRNEYLVSYLNRWGVLDDKEEWLIHSEYNDIISVGQLLIGRRGKGYTVYYHNEPLYKTIARPISELGTHILIEGDSAKLGLMNQFGEVLLRPQYDNIHLLSDHYVLQRGNQISLIRPTGKLIIEESEDYEEISGYNEEYFVVKKAGRWGFVDDLGRLRISNRYDDAKPFTEDLAPIKLRGKWGFINKKEELIIQPYYKSVSPFKNGRSIVLRDEEFGLIDQNGKEVLELNWKYISRLETGNYIVQDNKDQFGLVDANGSFIFRPAYDHLEDYGDRVLVSKNGAWGLLSYSRHPIFKINHEEIKVIGNFTMVKN